MICNKCLHTKTRVVNSRDHKKTTQVWRRRRCEHCGNIFTTYERLAAFDEIKVINSRQEVKPYNLGILLVDLYDALVRSSAKDPAADAYWIAQSIEDDLVILQNTPVSTDDIKQVSHAALSRFNTLAGIQYAAKYQLLEKIKRPRRHS